MVDLGLSLVALRKVFVSAIGLLLLSVSANFALAKENAKSETVQDLRYGVALYHFYQQSYFDALTELMVGESQQELPNHGETAELLRGGISLSYGLDQEAERIFNALLEKYREGEARDIAWFYLAKLKYLRGENDNAQSALEKIGEAFDKKKNRKLNEERKFMHANILLRNGDLDGADAAALDLDLKSEWLPYYYFNRGALQTQRGDWQQGVATFAQLQTLKMWSQESKSLRDRAYTAAGFAYLAGKNFAAAQQEFQKVRLSSPLVDRALLGYGWAAAERGDYALALSPWQALRERSLMDASVQESLIAVPYAYEKLQAPGNALREYESSVALLETELANIAAAKTIFTNAPVADLFEFGDALGDDWFTADDTLPINEHAPYIAHLIAAQDFQNGLKELRELHQLSDFIVDGNERLAMIKLVLAQREDVWREKVAGSQSEALETNYQNFLNEKQRLVTVIEQAEADQDGLALMSEEELELQQTISQGLATARTLSEAGEDVSAEVEKLQLFKGMLEWQAAEQYVPRLWEVRKHQTDLEEALEDTLPALTRVRQVVVDPEQFGVGDRIADIERRLFVQHQRVDQEIALAEQILRDKAVAELARQEKRLLSYLGQAKLAIARLYDLGSTEVAKVTDELATPATAEQELAP